jgi:hypothetical protein
MELRPPQPRRDLGDVLRIGDRDMARLEMLTRERHIYRYARREGRGELFPREWIQRSISATVTTRQDTAASRGRAFAASRATPPRWAWLQCSRITSRPGRLWQLRARWVDLGRIPPRGWNETEGDWRCINHYAERTVPSRHRPSRRKCILFFVPCGYSSVGSFSLSSPRPESHSLIFRSYRSLHVLL